MSFFMSADYSLSTKVMEIIYFIIGLLCIYCGVKNLKDKENPEPVGTFIFWAVLGVVLALGRWLPSLVSGILVVVMCIPAILKKVKKGAVSAATKAETEATYEKIGMKIFVPTLSIGVLAVVCAITGMGIGLSALNGVALGVLVAIILLMIMNRDNKPSTFLNDSERMLSTTPVNFNGQEIVPIQFLKALLPDPASLGPRTKGKTNIGCIFTGKKDGKDKTYYIYNVCDHQECYQEVGSQAISYTTGVPAMCGALMLLTGKWTTKGVHTVEEFDPDPYLAALDKYGLPRSESHSPALVD